MVSLLNKLLIYIFIDSVSLTISGTATGFQTGLFLYMVASFTFVPGARAF